MKYWAGKTKNGTIVNELNSSWHDIKKDLVELWLVIDNYTIALPAGLTEYNQFKSCSSVLGSKTVEIESRKIQGQKGNTLIRIVVDEKTNNIKLEIE